LIRRHDPIEEVHEGLREADLWRKVDESIGWYYGGVIGRMNQSLANFKASPGGESYVHAALKVATSANALHLIDETISVEYEKQVGKKFLDVAYWVPSESGWHGVECETMASYREDPYKVLTTALKGDAGLRVRYLVLDLQVYDDLSRKGYVQGNNFHQEDVSMPCMFHLPEIIEVARAVVLISNGSHVLGPGVGLRELSQVEMDEAVKKGFKIARSKYKPAS
jgi:hypothetical protein